MGDRSRGGRLDDIISKKIKYVFKVSNQIYWNRNSGSMQKMDQQNTGQISLEAFLSGCKEDPIIAQSFLNCCWLKQADEAFD